MLRRRRYGANKYLIKIAYPYIGVCIFSYEFLIQCICRLETIGSYQYCDWT